MDVHIQIHAIRPVSIPMCSTALSLTMPLTPVPRKSGIAFYSGVLSLELGLSKDLSVALIPSVLSLELGLSKD